MAKKQSSNQKELIIVAILSALLGLGGGYVIGMNAEDTSSNMAQSETSMKDDHSDKAAGSMMQHSKYEVSAENAPSVQIEVTEDAKSGYNIRIVTDKFTFAPQNANAANVLGEGHAHLYVDDVKIGRVYSNYYHYGGDFEGTKTFKVTLNANDHSEYAINGESIVATVNVTHDSTDPDHSHDN